MSTVSVEIKYMPRNMVAVDMGKGVEGMAFILDTDTERTRLSFGEFEYENVCHVDAPLPSDAPETDYYNSLEIVWRLMNSSLTTLRGIRSMMVGDLAIIDGRKFVVMSEGFEQVEKN